jgi:hypothetical protein
MFSPSFVTGRLITRFGAPKVVMSELVLVTASAAVRLTGVDVVRFSSTQILLCLACNFGFLGAPALVLECHRPEEKTRVQSFGDFAGSGL